MPISIFAVPQVVNLVVPERTGPSEARMNYPINRTDFRLVAGVTNEIEFFIRDIDRRYAVVGGDIRVHIVDVEAQKTLLFRPLTLIDPNKSLYRLTISPEDITDWPAGYLRWSASVLRPDGTVTMLWTDRDYSPHGFLTMTEGPDPEPPAPAILIPALFTPVNGWTVSGAIPAAAALGDATGTHSLSVETDGFSGTIAVEGSLMAQPTATDEDWFEIARREMSNVTGTDGISFEARIVWLRVRIRTTTGTVLRVLVAQ
jgi:hypothetical protein